jgi:histidine triad (HIT) family protein
MHAREVADAATLEALAARIRNHWRAPADGANAEDDATGHAP